MTDENQTGVEVEELQDEATVTGKGGWKIYAYGHDFGNERMKGATFKGKKEQTISFPTAIGKSSHTILKSMGTDFKESPIIRLQGETVDYVFGPVGAEMQDTWNAQGDLERYASKYSPIAVALLSSLLIPEKEYGLLITAGLPAEPFLNIPELRDAIKRVLNTTVVFSTDGGKAWRTVHMEVNLILMEGAAVFFGLPKMPGSNIWRAAIDIGGRTTDLYVEKDGRPQLDMCKGKPIGMISVHNSLQKTFRGKYNGDELTTQELRQIVEAYTSEEDKKPYPTIQANGAIVPPSALDNMAGQAVEDIGKAILTFTAQTWSMNDRTLNLGTRFNQVLGVGGGIKAFKDILKRRIDKLTLVTKGEFANALGYARASQTKLEKRKIDQEIAQAKEVAATTSKNTKNTES